MSAVFVLTYHHVSPVGGRKLSVTPATFEAHLKALDARGFKSVHIDEAARIIRGESRPPGRAVAVTFDDGYLDNCLFAYPVLKKLGIKATIFATTSWVEEASEKLALRSTGDAPPSHGEAKVLIEEGRPQDAVFTWDEAAEMAESGLVAIESHTHAHTSAVELLKKGSLGEDLALSRSIIASRLGKESTCVCWPFGVYNEECIEEAVRRGFTAAATVERGVNRVGSDPFRIKRTTAKDRGPGWVLKSAFIFSNPVLGRLYAGLKPK